MTIFSTEELVVLANMVGVVELFGVPELQSHRLNSAVAYPKGIQNLEKKNVLSQGKLTKKGFMVASLIEKYGNATDYLCLDQTDYVATGKQAILLHKKDEGVELTIQAPATVLGRWLSDYAILRRKGTAEEEGFRLRRSSLSLDDLQKQGIEAAFSIGQVKKTSSDMKKSAYILLLSEGTLYRLEGTELKEASQFWLTTWVVDALKIPYEVPEGDGLTKGKGVAGYLSNLSNNRQTEKEKKVTWFDW
ncbi:DUF5081 family protein [Vagococcus sp. BWB3-3]|uniref:DUF5081 family protein n=1 Tax=Vagococcus allomyrinae TaxID=2794353 RepID=A0A940P9L3_9ENTE|nr:DUF5081 family protein [Vagococcus allomyrinae]MBP1040974.1 DUF5081 family protein [Vagococcus allomyrinae]